MRQRDGDRGQRGDTGGRGQMEEEEEEVESVVHIYENVDDVRSRDVTSGPQEDTRETTTRGQGEFDKVINYQGSRFKVYSLSPTIYI